MSRDIRSFFQPKKVSKAIAVVEDDDVIPESPEVQIKNKKKEARKKRVLSDSDDEIFETKKKKITEEPTKSKNKKKTPQKSPLKEVKVIDLFGSGPIKRTEPIVKKIKVEKNTETGIHSDEEFDKSLLELDAVEESSLKVDNKNIPDSTNEPGSSNKKQEKEIEIKKEKSPHKSKESLRDSHSSKTNPKAESKSTSHKSKIDNENSSSNKKHEKEIKTKKENSPHKSKETSRQSHSSKFNLKSESKSTSHKSKMDNENKRKFAEFVDDVESQTKTKDDDHKANKKIKINESITEQHQNKEALDNGGTISDSDVIEQSICDDSDDVIKKKKSKKSLNESVLTDEERHERKMHSAALYQKYLNRSGPKHLGSKEIPEGTPNCLKDYAFLLTGVLDSFEKEEVMDAIVKYGGCVKSSVSKKVTHVIAGEDAGPAKMAKAEALGIKVITEDEFLEIIKSSSKKTSENDRKEIKKDITPNGKIKKESKSPKQVNGISKNKLESSTKSHDNKKLKDAGHREKSKTPEKIKSEIKLENKESGSEKHSNTEKSETIVKTDSISSGSRSESCESSKSVTPTLMWVDKYKPQNVKQIIGQHGDASNVKKLSNWLTKWYVNRKAKLPKPSPWAKNDDGGYYRAALLSGPPGVGKTTTVALVCKELGFDMVEFNASDTRSKNLIKEQISELISTTSLSGYARGDTGKQAVTKKHVLVMDEVDGMAGNEDRGGLQELINLIKTTSVPVICMCNDRNSQKMRSLVNYCYDLRFSRPRVDQIKSAMMSICYKEGVKVPPDVLSQLIVAANQDVRQTLHLLSVCAADPALASPDALRRDAAKTRKDVKLGPWEAVRKVFSAEDHKSMSIADKSDLFFYDYSLAPLFVQENYLQVQPHCPKNEILDRIARAADSISVGDLVDARIRRQQAWSLLPVQAMYSSVIPGHWMSGHVAGQIQFPGWLGKNSRATKMQRLCQEIHAHTRLSTSGSKSSIFLDYCTHLRDAIVTPLIKDRNDGITQAMAVLESYHLLREDLDSLTEMSLWPGQRNPLILVDSKVKAAMTRTYNKSATALPYAPAAIKKGRAKDEGDDEYGEEADDEPEDSDPENDALIKKRKVEKPSTSKQKASSSKEKPSSSKDKNSSKEKVTKKKK